MAATIRPISILAFVVLFSYIFLGSCQQGSPQNIETFYPSAPPLLPVPLPSPSPSPPTLPPPSPPSPPPPLPTTTGSPSSKNNTIVKAAIGTAAGSVAISALLFVLMRRHSRKKLEDKSAVGLPVLERADFVRFDRNIKGLIVDENGLDVLYWRNLQSGKSRNGFRKEVRQGHEERGQDATTTIMNVSQSRNSYPIQEVHLLRENPTSNFNQIQIQPLRDETPMSSGQPPMTSPPQTLKPGMTGTSLPEPEMRTASAIPGMKSERPFPPPPLPVPKAGNGMPQPSPNAGGLVPAAPKLPPPPHKGKSSKQSGKNSIETGQVKLKPLHWDKVNANTDHSMVWNKIGHGSLRVDDNLMEALFGTVVTNHKSPKGNGDQRTAGNLGPGKLSRQIFLLDPRKSQNIAIVLKSLSVSRKEILDALSQGRGLDMETIEKLYRIAPTKEEESKILEFDGESTRLADAESFLYHILKSMPSAFARFSAMLFRSNYQSDVSHLKELLQTFEMACKELRTRGIFMKLLEAILKAGNRMNQGTSRGDAQAFNLTALRKLSDVKSTDGKTTLLHFVVKEVVRAEGKRCIVNCDRRLSLSSSGSSTSSGNSGFLKSKEEREKEYMMLGLPLVGVLSSEFLNVKKAAAIDYESFSTSCEALLARALEIRQLVSGGCGEGGLFVKEMEGFLRSAEEELKALKRQQSAVMEVVKKTTEYYQYGAEREKAGNPFLIFVIVKDFLVMVDQACVEITRKQQQQQQKAKTRTTSGTGSSPTESPQQRPGLRFPVLSSDFFLQKSTSASSESDTDL